MTISDPPKISVRQEQERGKKACSLFPGECFPHWSHYASIPSLSSTPQWILVEKSNSLNPNLSLSPRPALGRLSPSGGTPWGAEGGHRGCPSLWLADPSTGCTTHPKPRGNSPVPSPAVAGRGTLNPGGGSSPHGEGAASLSRLSGRRHPGLLRCGARLWGVNLQGSSDSAERRAALIISSLLPAAGLRLARNASRQGTSTRGGWVRYKEAEKCRGREKETKLFENSFWAAPGWGLFWLSYMVSHP